MNSVLVLHRVTDIGWFNGLIEWLKHRRRLIPIEAVAAFCAGSNLTNACHITVDDGDQSFHDIIFPILKRHNVPASLFVSPMACAQRRNFWFQEIRGYNDTLLREIAASALGVPRAALGNAPIACIFKLMSSSQIAAVIKDYRCVTHTLIKACQNVSVVKLHEIFRSGLVSIGAHTISHPILRNEPTASCEYEIRASVNELSMILGHQVRYFAYPNGIAGMDFGEREERLLRDIGVCLAFTTKPGHLSRSDNPLRIPRISVSDRESVKRIMTKLLIGSGWSSMKRIVRTGEYVERSRLNRALCARRATKVAGYEG